jgi:hypothetical protein
MKKIFKALVFVLFVGGWTLASSAIYAVRVPNSKIPVFMTKNQLAFKDTYVDTRAWNLTEDRNHPEFLSRVIQLNKCQLLAHTVNSALGPVDVQLAAAAATPTVATGDGSKPKVN